MDAVAAKSDAVTAWKCTITDAYRRLPALTGADSRCGAFAPSACDRVKPYPSVTGPLPKLTEVYRRLRALIPVAGLLLLPRVTVSNRTPV